MREQPEAHFMSVKLFVAGNPLLDEDSLQFEVAKRVSKKLGMRLVYVNHPEYLLGQEGYLIDSVKGLADVRKINSSELVERKSVTAHDYDIGSFFRLLHAMGEKSEVIVIGIPQKKMSSCSEKDMEKISDAVAALVKLSSPKSI